jgi:hypothetical protein
MKYDELLSPRVSKVTHDATFLRRMGGFFIDLLIIDLIITAPFTPLFSRFVGVEFAHVPNSMLAAAFIIFLIIYCYFVLFEYLLNQTPGMMFVSTRVEHGTLPQLLLRNSIVLPVLPFVLFWIIEPVAIIMRRRGIIEQLSNTRTVHQREIVW